MGCSWRHWEGGGLLAVMSSGVRPGPRLPVAAGVLLLNPRCRGCVAPCAALSPPSTALPAWATAHCSLLPQTQARGLSASLARGHWGCDVGVPGRPSWGVGHPVAARPGAFDSARPSLSHAQPGSVLLACGTGAGTTCGHHPGGHDVPRDHRQKGPSDAAGMGFV